MPTVVCIALFFPGGENVDGLDAVFLPFAHDFGRKHGIPYKDCFLWAKFQQRILPGCGPFRHRARNEGIGLSCSTKEDFKAKGTPLAITGQECGSPRIPGNGQGVGLGAHVPDERFNEEVSVANHVDRSRFQDQRQLVAGNDGRSVPTSIGELNSCPNLGVCACCADKPLSMRAILEKKGPVCWSLAFRMPIRFRWPLTSHRVQAKGFAKSASVVVVCCHLSEHPTVGRRL